MKMEVFYGTGEDGRKKGKCYYVFSSSAKTGDAVKMAAHEAKVAKSLLKTAIRYVVRAKSKEETDILYLTKEAGAERVLVVTRS